MVIVFPNSEYMQRRFMKVEILLCGHCVYLCLTYNMVNSCKKEFLDFCMTYSSSVVRSSPKSQ